jgi:hypothetical protein
MKNLARITEIIKIEPFKITCRWTTGEIRVIDFKPEFEKWQKSNNKLLLQLEVYEKFENVTIKDGTLQWYSVSVPYTGLDGNINTQPLDLDPDNLYQQSKSISLYRLVLNNSIMEQEYAMI